MNIINKEDLSLIVFFTQFARIDYSDLQYIAIFALLFLTLEKIIIELKKMNFVFIKIWFNYEKKISGLNKIC